MKLGRKISALMVVGILAGVGLFTVEPVGAGIAVFIETLGFEDDVDVVVAPAGREFMVVPEENEDGSRALVTIIDIDSATGEPLEIVHQEEVLGYENGVDPVIIWTEWDPFDYLVVLPVENEAGSEAEIVLLGTDPNGNVLDQVVIELQDLGFREDVDFDWDDYTNSIGFFLLETEDGSARGIIALDVSTWDDGDVGNCLLLSSDGRELCDSNEHVDWLLGFPEGVDPLLYAVGDALRLVVPVFRDPLGDLLFVDFDFDDGAGAVPPVFLRHLSIYDRNLGTSLELEFPGYEIDVDMILLGPGQCGIGLSILVPVEGPDDNGDLYLVNGEWGTAMWKYSSLADPNMSIPGYEIGVDVLPMCGLVGFDPENRLAVPVENEAGTDANLFFVDTETGDLLGHVEDPAINPGLTVAGYEIGVDLVMWQPELLVASVEGAGALSGIMVLRPDALLVDSILGPNIGFVPSVDPIVAPLVPEALIVPVGWNDGSDSDIKVFTAPPMLDEGYSLEISNPGLELGRFERDVDLGLVDKTMLGELYLYVPEERPDGSEGRLRFQVTAGLPGHRVLAIVTEAYRALPASLYLVDIPTAHILVEENDLWGLEPGLDMANGGGPLKPGVIPFFPRFTSVDLDPDPTYAIAIIDPGEALEDMIELINGFDLDDFSMENRAKVLINKLEAVIKLVEAGDLASLCEAIEKLTNDILRKTDGESPPPDWVINPVAQHELEDRINDIINTLKAEVNALGGCPTQKSAGHVGNGFQARFLGC